METITKAVQIADNITDILNLPCVYGAVKLNRDLPDVHFLLYDYSGQGGSHTIARKGDWLCKCANGKWKHLSDKEYKELSTQNK